MAADKPSVCFMILECCGNSAFLDAFLLLSHPLHKLDVPEFEVHEAKGNGLAGHYPRG